MSELLLDSSETRPARAAAAGPVRRSWTRPVLIGGACAVMLAGFGVAASTVVADLLSPSKLTRGPSIGTGVAANWPDLKDGLPALAGTPATVKTARTDSTPSAPPPRMAALPDPMAYAAAPATPQAPAAAKATVVPPQSAPRRPAAAEPPTARIPVPTVASVLPPPPASKPLPPGRAVAAVSPRPSEVVRARDETPPVAEAAPRPEAARTHEAAAEKPVTARPAPPAKPSAVAAAKPIPAAAAKPAPVAKATPVPEKAPKPVAAHKPATPAQAPVRTAAAEPDSDDTEILGVKIPSFAPAGRKIQDGVSALGDAVRNAF